MSEAHPSPDDLAEAAAGLLDDERAGSVEDHLLACADCRAFATAFTEITLMLASEPSPPMPEAVSARLSAVLTTESAHRAASGRPLRPSLGRFGADLPRPARTRRLLPSLLVAAAAAGALGFGGYVVSARAGLNEPPRVSAISSTQLGPDARALRQVTDLDPHRFSRAWNCARSLVPGRITGLASAVVDGTPALLVYSRKNHRTQVTVVTGCGGVDPSAGPSAQLGR